MKKQIIKTISITLLTFQFSSCSSEKSKEDSSNKEEAIIEQKTSNDELKGRMLSGIYTVHGYGGLEQVKNDLSNDAAALTLLSYPFQIGQEGMKEVLSDMWKVNSKAELETTLEKLLNEENKYKAWDYARIANNVNIAYAAGYISKAEGDVWIQKTLAKTKTSFKTWNDFFTNYYQGLINWDKEDAAFGDLSKQLPETDLYKNNPLN